MKQKEKEKKKRFCMCFGKLAIFSANLPENLAHNVQNQNYSNKSETGSNCCPRAAIKKNEMISKEKKKYQHRTL